MQEIEKITKSFIIKKLHFLKDELERNYGVERIALVGSFAREEYTENSDIDLLVEFSSINFNNLAGLSIYLERIFGKKVDIVIKSPYLRKKFAESVDKEAVYV
jgi:hypothetical protein